MKPFEDLIRQAAQNQKIDEELFLAICEGESGYVHWRMHYDPGWIWFGPIGQAQAVASQLGISEETEKRLQMFSYGLCQIEGACIRELGFNGHLSQVMADPRIPLQYGAMKLRGLVVKYGQDNESDIISAWNEGSAVKTPGGLYANQTYVDRIKTILNRLRGETECQQSSPLS